MVTTVTSQKPYNWSDDVIKKAPTVQTRSSSGTGISRGARLELPVAVFNLSIYLFRLLSVFSVRLRSLKLVLLILCHKRFHSRWFDFADLRWIPFLMQPHRGIVALAWPSDLSPANWMYESQPRGAPVRFFTSLKEPGKHSDTPT